LASRREGAEGSLQRIRRETGAALLEVGDEKGLTLTEAASILGLSRPTVYCLLEDAKDSA
jgi:predicted DNA-binding protein (UPF0251 family)